MGYTHYWSVAKHFSDKQWSAICADARKIIAAAPCKITFEMDDETAPTIDNEMIRFNGFGDAGYETFLLYRRPDDAFCKTAREAYDPVVCAVLISANKHAPKVIEVRSDGGVASFIENAGYEMPDQEWVDALEFVTKTLGTGYALPRFIAGRK